MHASPASDRAVGQRSPAVAALCARRARRSCKTAFACHLRAVATFRTAGAHRQQPMSRNARNSPRCRAWATILSCSTASGSGSTCRAQSAACWPTAISAWAATRYCWSKSRAVDDIDFRYRIFNADGGEVEQCGNGARCFVHVRPRPGSRPRSARSASRRRRAHRAANGGRRPGHGRHGRAAFRARRTFPS